MTFDMQVTPRKSSARRARPSAPEGSRSPCAVACTLDIVGDKWTLLVVRDLMGGERTFKQLHESREGIPTNILAERLKRLEAAGIVAAMPYQERPVRYAYSLTAKGKDLGDVLLAYVRWGRKHLPGTVALVRA
jgi:DNA-binding HxlR family transcriptional regulator